MNFSEIKRINVVGTSGSGKSTLARDLAKVTGAPHIEIDGLFWKPNWKTSSDDEFFENLHDALSSDAWVLDGNYSKSIQIKWERVQLVVWIDLPFWLTLLQVIGRTIGRCFSRKEIWPGSGCRETFFKSFFHKDSIILWTVTTHKKVRREYLERMNDPQYAHIKFARLRSRKEMRDFLESATGS